VCGLAPISAGARPFEQKIGRFTVHVVNLCWIPPPRDETNACCMTALLPLDVIFWLAIHRLACCPFAGLERLRVWCVSPSGRRPFSADIASECLRRPEGLADHVAVSRCEVDW
jgi:hypothetical protein